MKQAFTALALALAATTAIATPALADELRLEVRTGGAWTNGQSADGTIGVALGHDWSLGGAFVGVEQSADKTLADGARLRWGTSGRIGTAIGATKVYATGGYNYGVGPNGTDLGAGVQQGFGPLYGKIEYKHFFNEQGARDSNAALVGVGVRF